MMSVRIRGRHLRPNGVRLHYLEFMNDRPALVLVPGITSPAITWAFVGERLAEMAHVYILDNRGRGLSEGGPQLDYTLDAYAGDVAGVIRALKLDRPIVLGHSMGARIAVRQATRFPDTIGQLILADPPMTGPGRPPYPFPLNFYLAGIDDTARGGGEAARAMVPQWTEEQHDLRLEWLPTCDKAAVEGSYRSFHEEDIWPELKMITHRSALLYAPEGKVVSEADARDFAGRISGCRSIAIPKVSHMIPWDDLDAFVAGVAKALA